MGATDFYTMAKGKTAKDAFNSAVDAARYEHGHGGYTGTIAEKHSFVMIPIPNGADPYKEATRLMDEDDRRILDKWGPAGCIAVGEGKYLFFGWASE
jgi:hypothetical protein